MGEVPIHALRCSNMLSRKVGDSNSSESVIQKTQPEKKREQNIEMGEVPIHAFRCLNMLSRKVGDSNSSMVGGDVKRIYLNSKTRPYYLRRCKRARPTDIESLPDELLSDILVRLPADHIHDIASLVCLRWYHIVHSSNFVKTQIRNCTYGLILSCHQVGTGPILTTATQGSQIETCEFSYKLKTGLYASCNGLALDYNIQTESLHILNPATKQELVLPSCSRHLPKLNHCGIAYAAASMEYKVTVPFQDVEDSLVVWSLAILTVGVHESWRNVPVKHLKDYRFLLSKFPLTTEGSIHWVLHGLRWVLTLDVETETFTTSIVPISRAYNRGSCFLSTGKFLSFIFPREDLSWEVWGMGSRDGEWSKVLPDIELGAHKWRLQQQFGCGKDKMLEPVGWVKYPEVLALGFTSKCRTCVFFNLKTREISSTELPGSYLRFNGHVHKNTMACQELDTRGCVFGVLDDGTLWLLNLEKVSHDFPVTGKRLATTKTGLNKFDCSSFSLWSAHASRLTGLRHHLM
ncbi:hypothetical protein OROGR_027165 [Orobanche gracilis]